MNFHLRQTVDEVKARATQPHGFVEVMRSLDFAYLWRTLLRDRMEFVSHYITINTLKEIESRAIWNAIILHGIAGVYPAESMIESLSLSTHPRPLVL